MFKREREYNANIQGWLLTKSDRINKRIDKFAQTVKTQNSTIAVKDFLDFTKAIQIMIAQELTYQKYEEDKEAEQCRSYTFSLEKQRILAQKNGKK